MTPVPWSAVENALVKWLADATGLPVHWEDQKAPQPGEGTAPAYGTLRVISFVPQGGAPELRRQVDTDRPDGQEVKTTVVTPKLLNVRAQLHTGSKTTGDECAVSLLTGAAEALDLPTVGDDLARAGLGLAGRGSVQNVAALIGTRFQGRAALELAFNVTATVSGFGGYIETVTFTPTVT